MRNSVVVTLAFLLSAAPDLRAGDQQPLEGHWTGGFSLNENWVAVNLRIPRQGEASGATADLLFPTYGGGENAVNVAVDRLRQTPDGLHFEVPARTQRVVFDGRRKDGTISGDFVYDKTKGQFGLTPWAYVPVDALEKYYGAYRVSPDRVISILRGWSHPRTLNYVDYKTGQVGTLWPSSESAFYSGAGLNVSYPVALRVAFDRDTTGKVDGLSWQAGNEAKVTARRLEFREARITCKNGDVTLGGTLILPPAKGRHPVVVVTPGDYGTHRNQLRLWAHHYVSRGIAALVFDSRGAGESTGPVNSSSFSDLANDVLAWVQTLKAHAEIDPARIGLFGFSNSAFTVSLAASRSRDVSFLILQSLVGVLPWKQESYRAETQLRVDGFPEGTVKQGAAFMLLKYEVARTGQGWEQIQKIMADARGDSWLAYTNPPATLERLRQVYELTMTYDPVPALEKLKIPVLAVWGAKDTYLPVPETIKVFERAMAEAGNRDYVVKLYPGGNHSMLVSETGSPSTGGKERSFVAGLWELKADWLLKHVGLHK